MFGYVIANRDIMTQEQEDRYRAFYCGLCRALRLRHGTLSRLTLTYDMTFLIMILTSMYEPEEECGEERCMMHPIQEHQWCGNIYTDYAADMNLALAYLNCMDDWNDDKNLIRRAQAGVLSGGYDAVREKYPQRCAHIEACLSQLAELEQNNSPDPDAAAKCFGKLMGDIFVFEQDSLWSERLREFGEQLGKFIYIMDAVLDLEQDKAKGSYNPLKVFAEDKSEQDLKHILTMLIGECAASFERLPLVSDADIMRNILYSGVWLRYNTQMDKRHKERGGAVES